MSGQDLPVKQLCLVHAPGKLLLAGGLEGLLEGQAFWGFGGHAGRPGFAGAAIVSGRKEVARLRLGSPAAGQKFTKGYTFEIQNLTLFQFICQNLVSVNPVFELKMRVLGVDSGVWVI
jgi:hypothetical protein